MPPKRTVSQWADEFGVLTTGADVGSWKSLPYQIAIMDAISHPLVEEVSFIKSARLGWTEILKHAMGYYIDQDPCSTLFAQPTIDDAKEFSKEIIQPFLDECVPLQHKVSSNYKDSSNTMRQKMYPGGTLYLVGANSPRGFRRVSTRIVLLDEIDGYPLSAGEEGDPLKLAMKRSETYWNRKICYGSTPTDADISRIEEKAALSSLGHFVLTCPDCDEPHVRKFREPKDPVVIRGETMPVSIIVFEPNDHRTAMFVCPSCGSAISNRHHRSMLAKGRWLADDWSWTPEKGFDFLESFDGHIGFTLWAGYSVSPNSTPVKLVKEFLSVKNDPLQLKTFVNTVLGEVWLDAESYVTSSRLSERVEPYTEWCPKGVLCLTAGVDIQQNSIELSVYGWGVNEECWNIDHEILVGDTLHEAVWIELAEYLADTYPSEYGVDMSIVSVAIDSGYRSTQCYDFCEQVGSQFVFPIKGQAGWGRPVIEDRRKRRERLRKRRKKEYAPEILGVDEIKSVLYRRLMLKPGTPHYVHFPQERDTEFFDQLSAERLQIEYRAGVATRTWKKIRPRNEALDAFVYAFAAMRVLNPDFEVLERNLLKKLDDDLTKGS